MSAANVGSIRAALLALLAVCAVVPVGTTQAQFLFWPRHGIWWSDDAPRRHAHRYRHTKPELAEKDEVQLAPNGPLQIIISITDQRISVYDNGGLIARSSVSTGIPRHPTPLGPWPPNGARPAKTWRGSPQRRRRPTKPTRPSIA